MARVTLQPLAPEHLAASFRWINDERIRAGLLVDRVISEEAHQAWFTALAADESQAVFAVIAGDFHVGNFGYRHLSPRHRSGDLWMYLGPEHQGRGLGDAMLKAGIWKGFDGLALRKIYLQVRTDNVRAISLYARAGFRVEGVLQGEQMYAGQAVDMLRMALFRAQWRDDASIGARSKYA